MEPIEVADKKKWYPADTDVEIGSFEHGGIKRRIFVSQQLVMPAAASESDTAKPKDPRAPIMELFWSALPPPCPSNDVRLCLAMLSESPNERLTRSTAGYRLLAVCCILLS